MTRRKRSTFRRQRSTSGYLNTLHVQGQMAKSERQTRIVGAARAIASRFRSAGAA